MVDAAGRLASAARSAPEGLLLLVFIAMSAIWATRTGTLPGRSFGLLGAGLQGTLWAFLYWGLGSGYRAFALQQEDSARSVLRKLALCLLLALLSTHICKLVCVSFLGSGIWGQLFYLRYALPPVFIGLWCAALLPRETRALYRAARTPPTISPLPGLVVLLASAAVLVSSADFAFEWVGRSAVDVRLRSDIVLWNAWVTNVLILFSAYALVFATTCKMTTALLVVSPVYVGFGLATLAKIEYMHSAVQPLDVIRVAEFMPLFHSFFGTRVLVATIVALGIWIGALVALRRIESWRVSVARRTFIGLASLAILLGLPTLFALAASRPSVRAVLLRLGGPDSQHREKARRNGLLLSFLSEIPTAFVTPPPNYSRAAVVMTLGKYRRPSSRTPEDGRGHGVNLIIYLVESLMDPDDLGLHYSTDPIPNLRALRKAHISGYGIVPEQFGGSANTEFEVLTGMTRSFLPEGSVPYRQYLRHRVLSLPCALNRLGYTTIAIQADPKYYYDRERVYDLLGFEREVWLRGAPGVQRAPRGPWPSDQAVVNAIIQASQGPHPFFAFAFPSSTHSPYNFGTYQNSDLDVLDPPPSDTLGELKEYVNAVRDADRAIGTLIEYFRRQQDSTIIAVFGDHVPPLSTRALQTFFGNLAGMPKAERARMLHRVPLLVWANFDFPRQETELSINALPSLLLEKMRIPAPGFLAVTDAVRREVPVLASYIQGADGRIWDRDSLPPEQRALVEDYRLLQYDLLLGKRYALREGVEEWCLTRDASP